MYSVEGHYVDCHDPQQRASVDAASNGSRRNERGRCEAPQGSDGGQPVMLDNGKYKCNHKCKDRSTSVLFRPFINIEDFAYQNIRCKHFCCREGLDKPPKAHPKIPSSKSRQDNDHLTLTTSKKNSHVDSEFSYDDGIDYLDLTRPTQPQLSKLFLTAQPQKKQVTLGREDADSKATRMANLDVVSSLSTLSNSSSVLNKSSKKTKTKKRAHSRRKDSSSEYDDSSLDGLFPPTRPAEDELENSNSGSKYHVESGSLGNSTDQNLLLAETEQHQPSLTHVSKQIGAISSNDPRAPLLDAENMLPQAPPKKEVIGVRHESTLLKRKAGPLNDTTNNSKNTPKRSRTDPQPASADNNGNEMSHGQISSSSELQTGPADQYQSQDEDFDQLLLQEFGDIVNFTGI